MAGVTHALLLTAGLGTRLHPLTAVRAKPAIPVAGEPMARRIIRWLAGSGVHTVVLNLHHLPETITAVVGDGSDLGVRARYSWEQPAILGSAGGPRQALDIIGADRFLIVNGDTLTDVALDGLVDAHEATGALATMAVVPNTRPDRYSGLRGDEDRRVTGVELKGSAAPSWHFVGVQVVERAAFAELPAGRVLHSVGGTYDALAAARPGSVRVHPCAAQFWDIGTVADYWTTHHVFAGGADTPNASAAGAHVTDSIVWDDVEFGDGARVERSIVTDGVRVAPGAVYLDTILIRGTGGHTMAVPLDLEQV
jgi:mannose-1-phosphate guanylyltransferase